MEQNDSEKRATTRSNVLFLATLRCGDIDVPVQLRNLSQGGAMVSNRLLPYPGTWLKLERNGAEVRGRLVWSADGKAGMRFEDPVAVDAMMRHVPRPRRPYVARSQRSPITNSRLRRWENENMDWWAHLYAPGSTPL